MKKNIITGIIVFVAMLSTCFAQAGSLPEVDKPMPDFTLDNITHYKTKKASLSDFKGKWLFLDFWSTRCTACIQSFPKVNAIQKEFKDELTWMMVGVNDTKYNKGIEALYERFRSRQNLEMASAYDSLLVQKWGIQSMPHLIIIDPTGVIRFITDGRDMNSAKIQSLLKGEMVIFYPKNIERPDFDPAQLSGASTATEDNTIFRSILTKWNGERQSAITEIGKWVKWPDTYLKKGLTFSKVPLYVLYNYAYIGQWDWLYGDSLYAKFHPVPILEIKDSSQFLYDKSGGGWYNYSIKLPVSKVSKENIMLAMQDDLKRCFGYDATLENRAMPIWKLVAKASALKKLQSKGGDPYATKGSIGGGFTMRNYPAKKLLMYLCFNLSGKHIQFIDESGILGNIDFTIEAVMTDIDDIRRVLLKYDLDLVRAKKEMKVLVIRDPKSKT